MDERRRRLRTFASRTAPSTDRETPSFEPAPRARSRLNLVLTRARLVVVLTRRHWMLRVTSVLALAAGAAGCSKHGRQDGAAANTAAPPMIAVPEPFHEFGHAVEGERLTHVFTVKNVGGQPLHIDRVATSCGCMAAVVKNQEVAPGGEGRIEVSFDTNHFSGDVRKGISVFSDDPIMPRAELGVGAQVEALLEFQPKFIELRSEPGKELASETWLTGKLKEQARLKIIDRPADPGLRVKILERPVDGGVGVQGLRFTVLSQQGEFGSGTVSLATGLANPDRVRIDYSWTVEGNIQVTPHHLFFSDARAAAQEQILRVTSRNADFKLRQVRVASGPFTTSFDTPDGGAAYEVRVSLKRSIEPPPTVVKDVGKLELLTNDPLEPRREVLIRFAPGPSPSAASSGAQNMPNHARLNRRTG